jgi:CubicO group peptidase (beta-lactamase class C family)
MKTLLPASLLLPTAFAFTPCPIFRPSFAPPKCLQNANTFQTAITKLVNNLDNATTTGETGYGPFTHNETSFPLGMFDAHSPSSLLAYPYTAPDLKNATEGVNEVTEDSIYRIGSLSKLLTAYTFLIEAGPEYLDRRVTDFVPTLREAQAQRSPEQNEIENTDWDAITLGALANHLASISRACKCLQLCFAFT